MPSSESLLLLNLLILLLATPAIARLKASLAPVAIETPRAESARALMERRIGAAALRTELRSGLVTMTRPELVRVKRSSSPKESPLVDL